MIMPKHSYGVQLTSGDLLAASIEAMEPTPPHLRALLGSLQEALTEMRTAKDRQQTLRAAAQQATRDLEAATEKAKQASLQLHCGLRSLHGAKSQKLSGFGMRPHRSAGLGGASAAPSADWGTSPPSEAVVRSLHPLRPPEGEESPHQE
jgi:hypothetical protein